MVVVLWHDVGRLCRFFFLLFFFFFFFFWGGGGVELCVAGCTRGAQRGVVLAVFRGC